MLYDDFGIYWGDGVDKPDFSLYHHGIKEQKWGNRRWQYADGSLTPEGRIHYGVGDPRHTGNYTDIPSEDRYKENKKFIEAVERMRQEKDENGKRKYTELQIANSMGMNSSEYRKKISLTKAENRTYDVDFAQRLKAQGRNNSEIARIMGLGSKGESHVRNLLNEEVYERMTAAAKNAKVLKDRLEKMDYIDVGKGSEEYLGISAHNLSRSLKILENEGYALIPYQIDQLGTGKKTNMTVLAKPGTEWKDVKNNEDKIGMVTDVYSEDGGVTMRPFTKPVSVDPKRITVRYAEGDETGIKGTDMDGVIELRRGVPDLDLGRNRYAQVRIAVDDTHYAKGMAMYADDLPDGIDIRINSNKKAGTPLLVKDDPDAKQVLKPMKEELENPFGANIKPDERLLRFQSHYIDEKTGEEKQSAINIVSEEGDWNNWSRTIASQMASKQPPMFAEKQLQAHYDDFKDKMDEINEYNNPTIKARMLEDLAGRIDSDAVHMVAHKLPRQSYRVLLPLPDNKDNEIYAPGYKNGEQLALVRYPHGSISEIPILTVNNDNPKAKKVIGDAIDAVGIPPSAFQRLSGADADGDTAIVLPTSYARIENLPQFKELINFDTKEAYPGYPGMTPMSSTQKGRQMGITTNLLTDLHVIGATNGKMSDDLQKDIVKVLKHSMVVIDSEKHKLDWKRSEKENDIQAIMDKYRGPEGGGAATLLSRSTSPVYVPERKEKAVSKMTPEEKERWKNGEIVYENTNRTRKITDYPKSLMTKEEKELWNSGEKDKMNQVKKAMRDDGRMKTAEVPIMVESKRGAEEDPYNLVSKGSREKTTVIERIYADHMTKMKALANECRKLARAQVPIEENKEAKQKYAKEVESINAKISEAKRNAPLERMAQRIAKSRYNKTLEANPTLDKEHQKREKGRQLDWARKQVGAGKKLIGSKENPLTEKEWEAIQAGAISKTKLESLLDNADMNVIKQYAIPKTRKGIPAAKLARAKALRANGMSRADIADVLDISESALLNAIGVENW